MSEEILLVLVPRHSWYQYNDLHRIVDKTHYKKSIELYDFLQNDTMKIAVLEEYNNFLKREIID